MLAEVTASAPTQMYHGTFAVRAPTLVAPEIGMAEKAASGRAAEDMVPPKVLGKIISPESAIFDGFVRELRWQQAVGIKRRLKYS